MNGEVMDGEVMPDEGRPPPGPMEEPLRSDGPSKSFRTGAWRVEKRLVVRPRHEFAALAAALVVAILIVAGLVNALGKSPTASFAALYDGAFGSRESALETLVQATPLILTGLAAAVAFRAGVWNIGAEGQFFAGIMGTWFVYDQWGSLWPPLLFVLMFVAAAIGGTLWAMIAGGLLVRYRTNVILSTVMLNFVILYVLSYLLGGPWQAPNTFYYQTARMVDSAFLPRFLTGSRLHWGFAIAIVAAAVVYWLIRRTTLGYEIRALGINSVAARYKGIRVGTVTLLTMAISGALAGIAGAVELLGIHHRVQVEIAEGIGFTGIIIALVARLHPLGVIVAAIAFGALVNGSTAMQYQTGIPKALVLVIEGTTLALVLIASVASRYRVRRVKSHG